MTFSALPPLHFLRAVEAAARHGNFRKAAEELALTPSAVSQQIHAVERALGVQIFVRQGRTVALSAEGESYCRDVRRVLLDLLDAGQRAKLRGSSVLRLTTVDFLAHEFLIPRLRAFGEAFPGLELRIETTMRVVELQGSGIDAGLRIRGQAGPGLVSEPIGDVMATPVCDAETARRLQTYDDLYRETLIEMRGVADGTWARALARRAPRKAPLSVLSLESYFETMTAAERGLGVAYGLFPMTTDWVARGRLSVPFPVRTPLEGGVYLVYRPNDPKGPLFSQVAEWLRKEYQTLSELPPGRQVAQATFRP